MRRMDCDERCRATIRAGLAGMTKRCGQKAPIQVGKHFYCAVHAAKVRARMEAESTEPTSSEDAAAP